MEYFYNNKIKRINSFSIKKTFKNINLIIFIFFFLFFWFLFLDFFDLWLWWRWSWFLWWRCRFFGPEYIFKYEIICFTLAEYTYFGFTLGTSLITNTSSILCLLCSTFLPSNSSICKSSSVATRF